MINSCQYRKKDLSLCGLKVELKADRRYLTDVCVLDSKQEFKIRTWAYSIVPQDLCYFHGKVVRGFFETKKKDGRRKYD